jgi:hypothetical protein
MRAVHCGIYWEGCLSAPVIALPSRGPPKRPTNVLVAEERAFEDRWGLTTCYEPSKRLLRASASGDQAPGTRPGSNLLPTRPRLVLSAAPKGGSCGVLNRWRLDLPERERFGLVYAREPMRHRRGDTICTFRTLPPLPLQHLGQRLVTEVPRLLVRKLADDEVSLLLSGTRSAERYAQNLHFCSTWTRTLCFTAYLAISRLRHLGQGSIRPTALRPLH